MGDAVAASLEELAAARHLRVLRILDLQPGRLNPVAVIWAVLPLRHDALEIPSACLAKQADASPFDVIDIEQSRLNPRHDAPQSALALHQRQRAKILPIDREQIEREEVRPIAAEQQVVEVRPAVPIEADDFAVQHGIERANAVRDLRLEDPVLGEHVPAARDQSTEMALDMRERAESVVLDFVQTIAMIE